MAEPDYKKQEKYRLHVASDNISHFLDVLEAKGSEHFAWAWEQIQKNIEALRMCFADGTDKEKDKCESFIGSYDKVHDLWGELDEKLHKEEKIEAIDEDELQKAIEGYRAFVEEMTKMFGLEEFSEDVE